MKELPFQDFSIDYALVLRILPYYWEISQGTNSQIALANDYINTIALTNINVNRKLIKLCYIYFEKRSHHM